MSRDDVRGILTRGESLAEITDDELAAAITQMFGSTQTQSLRDAAMAAVHLRASVRQQEQARALVDATKAFREAMEQAANEARLQREALEKSRLDFDAAEGHEDRTASSSSARLQFIGTLVAAAITSIVTAILTVRCGA